MSTTQPRKTPQEKNTAKKTTPDLSEEIERIQDLLRRMDTQLNESNIPLKELAQAVRTAGEGGRSIAQLLKMARQLESSGLDQDSELLRVKLMDLLDNLGQRRKQKAAAAAKAEPPPA